MAKTLDLNTTVSVANLYIADKKKYQRFQSRW